MSNYPCRTVPKTRLELQNR